MKIYFAGSISAGRHDVGIYHQIIQVLNQYGQVLTEFIGEDSLAATGETNLSDKEIHDRDIDWLLSADVLVAEVTTPSLGVGYEIGRAIENEKKILCLFRATQGKRLSAMIKGAPNVEVFNYTELADIKKFLERFFSN
jgi:2'-deoxynucleoside 5'-phosphate N-hydrolase